MKINPDKPAKISCSIHVKEYWAQAPPQDISPLLKSVPTKSKSSLSSWGSFTISHRCIVGLVAFAMRARTCNTFYKIIHLYSNYICFLQKQSTGVIVFNNAFGVKIIDWHGMQKKCNFMNQTLKSDLKSGLNEWLKIMFIDNGYSTAFRVLKITENQITT